MAVANSNRAQSFPKPGMAWWLDLTMDFLPLGEAYRCGQVCQGWQERQASLDSKARLRELRLVLAQDLQLLQMEQLECRRLLQEWHECLKDCSLKLGSEVE